LATLHGCNLFTFAYIRAAPRGKPAESRAHTNPNALPATKMRGRSRYFGCTRIKTTPLAGTRHSPLRLRAWGSSPWHSEGQNRPVLKIQLAGHGQVVARVSGILHSLAHSIRPHLHSVRPDDLCRAGDKVIFIKRRAQNDVVERQPVC